MPHIPLLLTRKAVALLCCCTALIPHIQTWVQPGSIVHKCVRACLCVQARVCICVRASRSARVSQSVCARACVRVRARVQVRVRQCNFASSVSFSLLFALRPEQPITISVSDPLNWQDYAASRNQDSLRKSRFNPRTPVLNLMMKLAWMKPQIEADLVVMSPPPPISLHGDEAASLAFQLE